MEFPPSSDLSSHLNESIPFDDVNGPDCSESSDQKLSSSNDQGLSDSLVFSVGCSDSKEEVFELVNLLEKCVDSPSPSSWVFFV